MTAPAFKFSDPQADLYVPDEADLPGALERCTHLGVGAHADDLEMMAIAPILECFGKDDKWFMGVTVGDGAGSFKEGRYADYSAAEIVDQRRREQREAARLGRYGAQFQLNHSSGRIKDFEDTGVAADLDAILQATQPVLVYTHNLADRHETHVGVALRLIAAIRRLPVESRPRRLVGCEVWGGLDWLQGPGKLVMPVSPEEKPAQGLLHAFGSQLAARRFDLGASGRRLANAVYSDVPAEAQTEGLVLGMDLTPLIKDLSLDPAELLERYLETFKSGALERLKKLS